MKMKHTWVVPRNSKRYDIEIKYLPAFGLNLTTQEVALLSSILNNQEWDFSINQNLWYEPDTTFYQLLPVKSGTIREDDFDVPFAPAKILLDDINQAIITRLWDARDGMFPIMLKASNVSVREYGSSHHIT